MKKDIAKEAVRLGKLYLSDKAEEEIMDYAKVLSKSELIQPVTSPSIEDLTKICQLLIDLQVIRERCVLVYLDVKRAKSRLERLEKEFLSDPPIKKRFVKEKNKESREIFLYSECKALAIILDRAKHLCGQCEIVIGLLDSHVWTLKSNNKVLSSVPHET